MNNRNVIVASAIVLFAFCSYAEPAPTVSRMNELLALEDRTDAEAVELQHFMRLHQFAPGDAPAVLDSLMYTYPGPVIGGGGRFKQEIDGFHPVRRVLVRVGAGAVPHIIHELEDEADGRRRAVLLMTLMDICASNLLVPGSVNTAGEQVGADISSLLLAERARMIKDETASQRLLDCVELMSGDSPMFAVARSYYGLKDREPTDESKKMSDTGE